MQFDRSATLLVGQGSTGTRLHGLHIKFDISKDVFATCNVAKVEVYGLSQQTRDSIKRYQTQMQLYAGYVQDGGEMLLFHGQVYTVSHEKQPPEVLTKLGSGDGLAAMRETRLAVAMPPGTTVLAAARQIAGAMGLPLGTVQDTGASFPRGFSFSGMADEGMRRIAAAGGYEHSVQDNSLQMVPRFQSTTQSAVLVSSATGMIGSPEMCEDGAERLMTIQPFVRWKVRCLLNPRITPARQVSLASEQVSGTFRVQKVRHMGDTHGPEWFSEMEICKELVKTKGKKK